MWHSETPVIVYREIICKVFNDRGPKSGAWKYAERFSAWAYKELLVWVSILLKELPVR